MNSDDIIGVRFWPVTLGSSREIFWCLQLLPICDSGSFHYCCNKLIWHAFYCYCLEVQKVSILVIRHYLNSYFKLWDILSTVWYNTVNSHPEQWFSGFRSKSYKKLNNTYEIMIVCSTIGERCTCFVPLIISWRGIRHSNYHQPFKTHS